MRSHGFPSSSVSSVSINSDNAMVMVLVVVAPFVSSSKGTEGLVTEQG